MKTEDWEEAFRDKVNGLDSPPPQTQWNHAWSWGKLEKRLANQSEPDKKRIAWWYYAAAAIVLLIPAFLTVHHLNRQQDEIGQLKTELARAKTGNPSSTHSDNSLPETAVVDTAVVDTAGEAEKTIALEQQIKPAKRLAVNQANRGKQGHNKKAIRSINARRQPDMPIAKQISAGELVKDTPVLVDTTRKVSDVAPASPTVAKIIRKATRAPVARTVVFIFQGKEKSQNTQLADASPKPAKKFIFLSGEKEAKPATKPEEAQNPFFFTAKLKATP